MERLITNIYIFKEIIKFLNLKDLLVVAKVNTGFRDAIIEYFQWKYKHIEAFKTRHYYIVSNTVPKDFYLKLLRSNETVILPQRENRILLSHSDFIEFINLNSDNIETLLLHFNGEYEVDVTASYYEDKDYVSRLKFNRLKKLGFGKMNLTKAQLNSIVSNCPNLRELYIRGILNNDGDDTYWFTHIPLNTLDKKKITKCIGFADVYLIDGYYSHREVEFLFLEHLITESTAQCYVVNLIIENKSESSNLKTENNQLTFCEVLAVGQFAQRPTFNDFHQKTINKLINLRQLTIVAASFIEFTKEFFATLNDYCKHLEYLQLEYCGVREFVPVHSLKELDLNNCLGLSWKDLKAILKLSAKLETFSSTNIEYEGEYEYFKISQNLQRLNLRYNDLNNNIMSRNLTNLTCLHWSSEDLTKQIWINAINCPNLQILEVKTSQLFFENIQDFKYLKKLILNVTEDLNSSDLIRTLQHPSLMYVALNDNPEHNFMDCKKYLAAIKKDCQSFKTGLLLMDICFNDSIQCYFDFWFTFLATNLNTPLRIKYYCKYNYYFCDKYCLLLLEGILKNAQRPSCLKSVNICGYNIDFNKLENNFDEAIKEAILISKDNFYNNKCQYILLENNCS